MSGSPKYTNVQFDAQLQAHLAAVQQQRAAEIRRQQEEARRQRIAAAVEAARVRAAAITDRLGRLEPVARGLDSQAGVTALLAELRSDSAGLIAGMDEAGLKQAGKRLRDLERSADRLGIAVARELTGRRHDAALAAVVAPLDQVADRATMDPEGHAAVLALTAETTALIGDDQKFPESHRRLSVAVEEHLGRVRDRLAMLTRLAGESTEVDARLRAALADAEQNGIDVPERARWEAGLVALRAEHDGAHVSRWRHRLDELRRATDTVQTTVAVRLDQLDRMAMLIEAAGAALPAAGLQVVDGSLVASDETVSFRACRPDGSGIELTVSAGDARGTRMEYRVDAADRVVEHTADGEVSRCDLTEDLLELFHDELGAQGVQTDGLHWENKPQQPRPPAKQQAVAPAQRDRAQRR